MLTFAALICVNMFARFFEHLNFPCKYGNNLYLPFKFDSLNKMFSTLYIFLDA